MLKVKLFHMYVKESISNYYDKHTIYPILGRLTVRLRYLVFSHYNIGHTYVNVCQAIRIHR